MLNRLANKINTYYAVKAVLVNYHSSVVVLLALSDQETLMDAQMVIVENFVNLQSLDVKGFADYKRIVRVSLESKTWEICRPLTSFAIKTNNYILIQQINFTLSEFERARYANLLEMCDLVVAKANENLTALADYGITAPQLAACQADITLLRSIMGQPREAKALKEAAGKQLKKAVDDMDAILIVMDGLIAHFKTLNIMFYDEYFTARKIVDLGSHEVSLRGKITDSIRGVPLQFAKVELLDTPYFRMTSRMGNFEFKSLPSGVYTIKVTLIGFNILVLPNIPVEYGKTETVNIMLVVSTQNQSIPPNTDTCIWNGEPNPHIIAVVTNVSGNGEPFDVFITAHQFDPIPQDKQSTADGQQTSLYLNNYQQMQQVFIRIFNPSTTKSVKYTLTFEDVIA